MKKLLTATVCAACLISGAALAEQVKVGIASEPYPPFASPDASGNWVGWEVDIAMAICKAAELDCAITPVGWDGIIPSLTSGQIDMITASMSITPEREKVIDFSDKYYNTPTVIVAAKDLEMDGSPESMSGKILGVQVATVHQAYAEKHFKATAAEIKLYQTQDEANQDLVAGRVDAVQADSIALDAFLSADGKDCCETKGKVADDLEILGPGVGVGLRKGDDALKTAVNKGIAAILADGTYETITKGYFASSIYGE